MDYSFLRDFPKRMRVVGLYAVLINNSSQKQIWKTLGFEKFDEQINILFSILLFIMEKSLCDEYCTIDDIADFLIGINARFFKKQISNADCKDLSKFIVEKILTNDGLLMDFDGYDYEKNEYKKINISYIGNKIIYENRDNRRSSFYLTENGYSLLLGTLEIESHMRLTIQEMIFTEHLKKNNYDKSLTDIKNIFEYIRIEKQKNIEAIAKIKQNILNFTIEEYNDRIDATFKTIKETRKRLEQHKKTIQIMCEKIEQEQFDVEHISNNDLANLKKLQEISMYLDRTIDYHLDIMQSYNDYREICAEEMENFLKVSLVERFSFSQEIFEKIIDNPNLLESAFNFLHPLLIKDPNKIFNINKIFVPQHKREDKKQSSNIKNLDFDEKQWLEEKRKEKDEKYRKYKNSLRFIFRCAKSTGHTTLYELSRIVSDNNTDFYCLIPNLSIFKEIIIDLIRMADINIEQLKIDLKNKIVTDNTNFDFDSLQIGELILSIVEESDEFKFLKRIIVEKIVPEEKILFFGYIPYDADEKTAIICTNIKFSLFFS